MARPAAGRVTLARIVRPRGRKGEVAAQILTDFPQRLKKLRQVWLVGPGAQERPARIRACWLSPSHGGQAIFHFEDCDSISDAEKLVGLEIQIPLAERAPLPSRQHYVTDLVGCEVWERRAGGAAELLGAVRDVEFPGATPLLAVESSSGEILIPLAEDICVLIDPARRRIEVVLPEGLRDLNR
ncbi:MAG TPA: ribosome maturation factor RimM [Candidatus Acidoferrales bacterium]|nr:ribosome maturation factor RimM [Candidatus Acidoferrales bacterium]